MCAHKGATEYSKCGRIRTYNSAGVVLLQVRLANCFAELGAIVAPDVGEHIRLSPVTCVILGRLAFTVVHQSEFE